jgi:hypothetical protein
MAWIAGKYSVETSREIFSRNYLFGGIVKNPPETYPELQSHSYVSVAL